MTICIVWLLTYVGQVLDLAVENRPANVVHGRHGKQHSYYDDPGMRKQSEVGSMDGNLLHLKTYPYEGSHRDELSEWLVYNEKQPMYSWSPTGMLIEEMMKEPRDLQAVFLSLSPTVSNVLHPEYVSVTSPYVSVASMSKGPGNGDPLLEEPLVAGQRHRYERARQHQQFHQRVKKRRNDYKHSENAVGLPILVYDAGDEGRNAAAIDGGQSNRDEQVDYKFNTAAVAPMELKTDVTYERDKSRSRELQKGGGGGGGFVSSRPFVYETNKLAEKRNHIVVGRRSVNLSGDSSSSHQTQPSSLPTSSASAAMPSQFMLRSIRAKRQYDVPQVECPPSEEGMERFACPTMDRTGRYRCIDDHVLCDGFIDCPGEEDEDMQACMFYKTTKAHLDVLADAILRWARGR